VTVRDQMFLLCCLMYEQQNEEIFQPLPEERAQMLKKELHKFDRFPKEMRLTMALKLLGFLVQHIENPHIEMIHPTWIAEILKKEDPQLVFELLHHFSVEYSKEVVSQLDAVSEPVENPLGALSPDIIEVILRLIEERFESMAAPFGEPKLSIENLYLLREEDLVSLMRQIGLLEIARAFVLAGKDKLAALVGRFPQEMQDDFLAAAKTAQSEPREKQKVAAKRLQNVDLPSLPIEESTLQAGLLKVGSVLKQRRALSRKVAQRLPMKLGKLLLSAEMEEGVTQDENQEIMDSFRNAIARNKIDKQYLESRFSSISDGVSIKTDAQSN
jgi:hypothetical protein